MVHTSTPKPMLKLPAIALLCSASSCSSNTGTILSSSFGCCALGSFVSTTSLSPTSWSFNGTSFTYHELVARWLIGSCEIEHESSCADDDDVVAPMIASLHFFKYDRTRDLLRRTSARLKIDSVSAFEFIEMISSSPTMAAVDDDDEGADVFAIDDSSSAVAFFHDSTGCGSGLVFAGVTFKYIKRKSMVLTVLLLK